MKSPIWEYLVGTEHLIQAGEEVFNTPESAKLQAQHILSQFLWELGEDCTDNGLISLAIAVKALQDDIESAQKIDAAASVNRSVQRVRNIRRLAAERATDAFRVE